MSERNVLLLLYDIRASILKIYEYTNGMEFVDYIKDSKSREAVERNFEIIGEAASNLPDDFKKLNSQISWRIIKDFRNYLIHAYFGVNNSIVWDTIQNDLPFLLTEIELLIDKNSKE